MFCPGGPDDIGDGMAPEPESARHAREGWPRTVLERAGYTTERATEASHLAAQPGVAAVSLSSYLPLQPDTSRINAFVNDGPMEIVGFNLVARGYFETIGIPIVRGRAFTADEQASGSVIVVNETMARRLWPGRPAIGQFITTRQGGPRWEVIGVTADVMTESLRSAANPYMYLPFPRIPKMFSSATHVIVRMDGEIDGGGLIRRTLQPLGGSVPMLDEATLAGRLSDATAAERQSAIALGGFAILAWVLATSGVFGLASYGVERRASELGIRIALGARPGAVLRSILNEHLVLVAIALAVGLPAAAGAGRLLSAQLYGVAPSDPWTLVAVAVALAGSGLAAVLLPARRATRIDPSRRSGASEVRSVQEG
ncbi:MAG: FtsX-like permease family protein [Acidobacteriota bacterium]